MGAVSENGWPYGDRESDLKRNPPERVITTEKYKIVQSFELKTLEEIKSALQYYGPVVMGITIYDSIKKAKKTGIIPDPAPKEKIIGGHSICIVGYDDDKKLFKFKNSWDATSWGDKGYGYISYDYIKNSSEAWIFWL